jgi:glutathione S-transferase
MVKVYGIPLSPFVRKVRVVLAEKNIRYDLDPVLPVNVSPEFRQMSPLGKIPAFQDGDKTLADSSVICAYLERTRPMPALYPTDPYDYARALWFEEYADGGLVPVAGGKVFFQLVVGPKFFKQETDRAIVDKAINEELPPMYDYLDRQLESGATTFVGSNLTIGDIGIASIFVNLQHAGVTVDPSRWPKLARTLSTILGRPSFATVIKEEQAMLKG